MIKNSFLCSKQFSLFPLQFLAPSLSSVLTSLEVFNLILNMNSSYAFFFYSKKCNCLEDNGGNSTNVMKLDLF